jgi:hypothetical protein
MEVKVKEERSKEDAKKRKENHAVASASASFLKKISFSISAWNCRDQGFAHPGAAGVSAQRRHVPLGL